MLTPFLKRCCHRVIHAAYNLENSGDSQAANPSENVLRFQGQAYHGLLVDSPVHAIVVRPASRSVLLFVIVPRTQLVCHGICNAVRRRTDGIGCKVGIPLGRPGLGVAQQSADHGE